MKYHRLIGSAGLMLAVIGAFGGGRLVAEQLSATSHAPEVFEVGPIGDPLPPDAATATPHLPPPPRPEFVNPDGTINKDKLPKCFKQLDKEGKHLKDKDGKDRCIPAEQLIGPRSDTPPQP